MLSYLNPNAARKTLYPSLVKHIVMNQGVIIWKPDLADIDGVFGVDLFLEICQSEQWGRNIKFAVDDKFNYKLHRSNDVWSKAIRNKIVLVRKDEYNEMLRNAAIGHYNEEAVNELDLVRSLRDLKDDLAKNDYTILDSIRGRPEWSEDGLRAIFVAVVQDIDMYRSTAAHQLLVRPGRWEVTARVANNMPRIWQRFPFKPHLAEIGFRGLGDWTPPSNDPEKLFEFVRDLMSARYAAVHHPLVGLSFPQFCDAVAQMSKEMEVARGFLNRFKNMNVETPGELLKHVKSRYDTELNNSENIWKFVTTASSSLAGKLSHAQFALPLVLGMAALQIFKSKVAARLIAKNRKTKAGYQPNIMSLQNPEWWINPKSYDITID